MSILRNEITQEEKSKQGNRGTPLDPQSNLLYNKEGMMYYDVRIPFSPWFTMREFLPVNPGMYKIRNRSQYYFGCLIWNGRRWVNEYGTPAMVLADDQWQGLSQRIDCYV